MDFFALAFLYWVWNIICKIGGVITGDSLSDTENGAAYFFSTDRLNSNKEGTPVNKEYDDNNPNW